MNAYDLKDTARKPTFIADLETSLKFIGSEQAGQSEKFFEKHLSKASSVLMQSYHRERTGNGVVILVITEDTPDGTIGQTEMKILRSGPCLRSFNDEDFKNIGIRPNLDMRHSNTMTRIEKLYQTFLPAVEEVGFYAVRPDITF